VKLKELLTEAAVVNVVGFTMRMRFVPLMALTLITALMSYDASAKMTADPHDMLVKFADRNVGQHFAYQFKMTGLKSETLGAAGWVHIQMNDQQAKGFSVAQLALNPNVLAIQPNYKIYMIENIQSRDQALASAVARLISTGATPPKGLAHDDNPPIPIMGSGGSGEDPDYSKQWGMVDIGVKKGWASAKGAGVVVAVIDTGVDYTHEDLVDNLWRNPGEMGKDAQGRDKSNNAVDDDANGFVDDIIGWDFVSNDNKPYDLAVDPITLVTQGGNPGHGTHCAGNVAARAGNGKGTIGVAPEAKIMAVRFLSEKGQGDTASAIKAINYAVKMGAKVLSNSWGSEGDDQSQGSENQALKDSITAAQNAGVLFIAAAGNGHNGVGYNNDTDPKPGTPASYDMDNIISVAAIDANNQLGSFSNWGARTVDIAAPGVKIFSTMVNNAYSDTVVDVMGITATWDGTSMATPHVAGAAALYWSKHPTANWKDVKDAIMKSATPVPALAGKMVSGGKLNVDALMNR
jgi:thermitase